MTYPFVQSYVDRGPASGPRAAVVWHMAEGGNTVAYLAKANPNSVSVHFVIEYSGRIVQMLRLDHMHTSIRVSDIRTNDDAPFAWGGRQITYGRTAARASMGTWADTVATSGPNHASIAVEIEGFASEGPNGAQKNAMATLWADMRGRFPGIRSLTHRDFQSYKPCGGKKLPWEVVGWHASAEDDDMLTVVNATLLTGGPRNWRVAAGVTLNGYDPARPGVVVKTQTFTSPSVAAADAEVFVSYPGTTRPPVPNGGPFLRVTNGTFAGLLIVKALVSLEDAPPPPPPDCTAAVAAATAPLQAQIDAAKAALGC